MAYTLEVQVGGITRSIALEGAKDALRFAHIVGSRVKEKTKRAVAMRVVRWEYVSEGECVTREPVIIRSITL